MVSFKLNGENIKFDGDEDMPLLWFIREQQKLTATKYGCGVSQCGACTVNIDGDAARSCVTPVASLDGAKVTTLEGLNTRVEKAVQESWEKMQVVQCGYCQSGQIMSAAALLESNPKPNDAEIDEAMSGNLCRCATYTRIRAAIHDAAGKI